MGVGKRAVTGYYKEHEEILGVMCIFTTLLRWWFHRHIQMSKLISLQTLLLAYCISIISIKLFEKQCNQIMKACIFVSLRKVIIFSHSELLENTFSTKFTIYGGTHLEALNSVQFSRSVVSDSLWPHESQHKRPPCPSSTPGVHSDSRPSPWCHPAISSSVVPFFTCPQSLPASQSFQWVNSSHEVAKVLEFQL